MERRGFPGSGSGARPRSAPGDALSPGCGGLCHVSPVPCSLHAALSESCRPKVQGVPGPLCGGGS